MVSFERESFLCDPVSEYARRRTFSLQDREVPFYEYRMDLFAFSRRLGLSVAVELKLRNWRKAVQQSLLYQLCADLVFIALPTTTIQRVDTCILQSHGIGLIQVDVTGRCRQLVPSLRSTVVLPEYRAAYIDFLERGV